MANNLFLSRKTLNAALAVAAATYECAPEAILSATRVRHIAHARAYAMWLLRQPRLANDEHTYSLPDIGRCFGRHHTTVLKAAMAHEGRMNELRREAA